MKRILTLMVLISLLSNSLFSQNKRKLLPKYKLTEEPTYTINNALSSLRKMEFIKPRKIKKIEVFNYKKIGDKHINRIPSLGEFGIVKITLKKPPLTITQQELNKKYNLPYNNDIYFDGFLIDNTETEICIDAIYEIKIIKQNKVNKLYTDVINIWTLPMESRFIKPVKPCSFSKSLNSDK